MSVQKRGKCEGADSKSIAGQTIYINRRRNKLKPGLIRNQWFQITSNACRWLLDCWLKGVEPCKTVSVCADRQHFLCGLFVIIACGYAHMCCAVLCWLLTINTSCGLFVIIAWDYAHMCCTHCSNTFPEWTIKTVYLSTVCVCVTAREHSLSMTSFLLSLKFYKTWQEYWNRSQCHSWTDSFWE